MTKKSFLKLLSIGCMAALLVCGASMPPVAATTFNTITVDCFVNVGAEWQVDENMGPGGMGTPTALYITWDATNLYVGISPMPNVTTIYIDTAPGGTNVGSIFGTHFIANPGVGYEYSYSDLGGIYYETGAGGAWVNIVAPPGTGYCSPGGGGVGPDVEWAIPWANIGVPPGTRVTILVQDRTGSDIVTEYWPAVPGNSNPPPSFTQGFIFAMPPLAGVSPAGSPTAVSVQEAVASSVQNWAFPALVALPAAGLTAVLLTRRRRLPAQE